MSSTSRQASATGRARSCTACRQVKLACDARKTAPKPCSRCVSKNIECRFDSHFKRIATRKITQEITSELHALRTNQFAEASQSPTTSPGHSSQDVLPTLPNRRIDAGVSSQHGQDPGQDRSPWLQLNEAVETMSHSLDNILLRPETSLALFKHFERYCYPHAPFLQKIQSISSLATRCPILFWTIILVSSQRSDTYDGLWERLCGPFENLLAQIVNGSIQSVEIVHAILLLCLWPIPKVREQNDPSWNFIGIAHNAAMQMNCHDPLAKDSVAGDWRGWGDFAKSEYSQELLSVTWMSCFDIGIRLSSFLGFPPPLSSTHLLKTVKKASLTASHCTSSEYRAQLDIRQVEATYMNFLLDVEDSSVHFNLTRHFEEHLDEIEKRNQKCWTPDLEVELQRAKLYLYSLTFTIKASNDPNEAAQISAHRAVALHKGFQAASGVIASMTTMSLAPADDNRYPAGILTFYPKHYFTALFFAAVFLFKMLSTSHAPTRKDYGLAITRLAETHKIFQSFPNERDHTRAAIHIEVLVAIIRSDSGPGPWPVNELVVTNRLGASLMWDSIFRAAHHRNRHPISGKSMPSHTWKLLNDEERNRLPLAPEQKAAAASPNLQDLSGGQLNFPDEDTNMSWLGPWDAYMSDFGVGLDPWHSSDAVLSDTTWSNENMLQPLVNPHQPFDRSPSWVGESQSQSQPQHPSILGISAENMQPAFQF